MKNFKPFDTNKVYSSICFIKIDSELYCFFISINLIQMGNFVFAFSASDTKIFQIIV